VKMSFVTAAMLYSSRMARLSASISAVFPEPTGLASVSDFMENNLTRRKKKRTSAHPPIPTVKARLSQSRSSVRGCSRAVYDPGPSKTSCVWPWSSPSWLWATPLSCECVCDMMYVLFSFFERRIQNRSLKRDGDQDEARSRDVR
jgi:hypothetical protein